MKKFPDFVPPTKVSYLDRGPTLHLRRCMLQGVDDPTQEWTFDKEEIRIGSMDDNDIVLHDDTVSRYHCKIVQDDTGYVLVDNRSTNGTFINKVRVREAFIKPGAVLSAGQSQLRFNAKEEEVQIVPSRSDRCAGLIGGNARMREIYSIIEKIAPTATTVVIDGETGTGKEVVAQAIHSLSPRSRNDLVVFDCGAVPPNLIESELFGHEKGSFTGAVMTRQGLFEQADGGTLFLDELGELPIDLQPKLLRALEQREVRRVGSAKAAKVDVRIIAATNRNLEDEVKAGRFRQDLFYRLSVVRLHLPSLRERADDIPLLLQHFLDHGSYNKLPNGQPKVRTVARDALTALQNYPWPGNVRELVNVVERAVSFCDAGALEVSDLPDYVRSARAPSHAGGSGRMTAQRRASTQGSGTTGANPVAMDPAAPAPAPNDELLNQTFKDAKERWVASFERNYIAELLRRNTGNISHAARESDIDRKYFRKLMKKYDIEAAGGDDADEGSSDVDDDAEDDALPAVDAFSLPPGADPSIDWGLTSHLHADGSPRIIERALIVPPELAGLRLDHFIKTQISRLSRTKIQQVIGTQLSRGDGHALKPATTVAAGERYLIRRPARAEPPCPRTFTTLYEDARLLVIDKPAGLPVHASAKFYFNTLTRVLDEKYPGEPELQIAHRLDRETSGCLVVARDRAAAVVLKQAFASKTAVSKQYVALVHGQPPWDTETTIDLPLRVSQPGDPTRLPHVRMLTGPGGSQAITRVRVEQRGPETALVRCTLLTGRQHQIRAHLAAQGFPIVGDKLYAHGDDAFIRYCDEGLVADLAALFVLPRHALHAAKVSFPHPDGGSRTVEAPLPADIRSLLSPTVSRDDRDDIV